MKAEGSHQKKINQIILINNGNLLNPDGRLEHKT